MQTILIIDDESSIRENIAQYLQAFNFKTVMACNGSEGVQKAMECNPDLIVCDIDMPILDGYGVYKEIQQINQLSLTPFIFLTAKSTPDELRKGMTLGADDYITKPFKLNDILLSINRRLEKSERLTSASEEKLNALTQNNLVGIFFYQETGFVFSNKKLQEILEYKQTELKNLTFDDILTGGNKAINSERAMACLQGILTSTTIEGHILTKSLKAKKAAISIKQINLEGIKTIIGILQPENTSTKSEQTNNYNTYLELINLLESANYTEVQEQLNTLLNNSNKPKFNNEPNSQSKLKLSTREKEVLTLICKGKTNSEIAEELFLSNRTVENHRAKLLSKTGSKNTAQLVVHGIQKLGIVVS